MDVNCWWMLDPHHGNMGDIITPVIVNRISQDPNKLDLKRKGFVV